jgi:hypothetical protein
MAVVREVLSVPAPEAREIFVAYPWALYDDRVLYKRAFVGWVEVSAGGADTGPAPQQVLEEIEDLVEGQAGVRTFGSSRLRVRVRA